MAGQDDKKRAHASEEAPARLESDCKTLPVGTPAAKAAHAAEKARSAGSNRTLEHLGREVERLANPRNSLFEEAGVPLSGVHRGSALSLITGAVSGLGVAFGVSLVAIVRPGGGHCHRERHRCIECSELGYNMAHAHLGANRCGHHVEERACHVQAVAGSVRAHPHGKHVV